MTPHLDAPIVLSITPKYSDYLRFVFWAAFQQMRLAIVIAAILMGVFAIAPLVGEHEGGLLAGYRGALGAMIVPIMVLVVVPAATLLAARRRWRSSVELRAPKTIAFGEGGIDVAGETFRSHTDWLHITKARRWNALIFLGLSQGQYHLVPTHDFQSADQLERFRSLVRSKVTDARI